MRRMNLRPWCASSIALGALFLGAFAAGCSSSSGEAASEVAGMPAATRGAVHEAGLVDTGAAKDGD